MENLAKEYRHLLTREESLSVLDRSLRLAENVMGVRVALRGKTLSLEPLPENHRQSDFARQIIDECKAQGHVPEDLLKAIDGLSTAEDRRKMARVVRTAVILGVLARLAQAKESSIAESRYSLFMDSCLLAFHHAYFALLPALETRQWVHPRRVLVESFKAFAASLHRASDAFTVLALYFDAKEDAERAGRYYREAFLATHSDDPDFMSRLQACWTFMIERAQFREALDLLLEVYPRSSRKDLDEMKELIQTTFDVSWKPKRASGG